MEISRKDFIKGAAGAAGLLLLQPAAPVLAEDTQTKEGMAMLVDVTKCVSCWWCYAACKEQNQLPQTIKPDPEQPPQLGTDVWTTLKTVKRENVWFSRKQACNHCTEAACVEVCPTGALSYNSLGFVQYDKEKCSGCGYCAEFCPFGVPQVVSNKVTGATVMNKCTFCHGRVTNGEPPACAAACTTGAIRYGERSELIREAKDRVAALHPDNPQASLYGADELGGLHVMYILDDSPEVYDLPTDPEVPAAATIRSIFKWLGIGLTAAVLAGFGLNYLVARLRMPRGEK